MDVRQRFVAKPYGAGKQQAWGVYDTFRGSWPVQLPGYGPVAGGFATERDAQAEAARLELARDAHLPTRPAASPRKGAA